MIPIFDSLAHPTLTGDWLNQGVASDFNTLSESMTTQNYIGSCAIGMDNIESYSHEDFIRACSSDTRLVPVAGFNPQKSACIDEEIKRIKDLGYRGIKIHPRFSDLDLNSNTLVVTFNKAHELGLVIFFCTYYYCQIKKFAPYDPFLALVKLLKNASNCKVILVHGGAVELLKYAELVRFNSNLLLDLSLTIHKYEGSSIDNDIQFLFKRFDERICIGSDFPEISQQHLRKRFERFSSDISTEKKENIAFKNIMSFMNL